MVTLKKVLAEGDDSYYHKNYPNWPGLNEEYRKILTILEARPRQGWSEFVAACDTLMQLQASQKSYIRYDLYLDLEGHPVEFIPCCR